MELFYNVKSDDLFIYHYTRATTATEHILKSGRIRLSSFIGTNDPREYKCWEFGFRTNGTFDREFDDLAIGREVSRLVKSNCYLLCLTRDDTSSVGMGVDKIYGRGFCRSRMWAQYAENHKGVCLVFDRVALRDSIKSAIAETCTFYCGPVGYRNRSQAPRLAASPFILDYDAFLRDGLSRMSSMHVQRYHQELFFEKSLDWADEREYRYFVMAEDSRELFIPIEKALLAIVVGDNMTGDAENEAVRISRERRLNVGKLNWKSGVPELLPLF
jgi:hypothetical protein